jgi:hypothetical protein
VAGKAGQHCIAPIAHFQYLWQQFCQFFCPVTFAILFQKDHYILVNAPSCWILFDQLNNLRGLHGF